MIEFLKNEISANELKLKENNIIDENKSEHEKEIIKFIYNIITALEKDKLIQFYNLTNHYLIYNTNHNNYTSGMNNYILEKIKNPKSVNEIPNTHYKTNNLFGKINSNDNFIGSKLKIDKESNPYFNMFNSKSIKCTNDMEYSDQFFLQNQQNYQDQNLFKGKIEIYLVR